VKIELLRHCYTDFSILKNCGFDTNGAQTPVVLDAGGNLPEGSPHRAKFGHAGRRR